MCGTYRGSSRRATLLGPSTSMRNRCRGLTSWRQKRTSYVIRKGHRRGVRPHPDNKRHRACCGHPAVHGVPVGPAHGPLAPCRSGKQDEVEYDDCTKHGKACGCHIHYVVPWHVPPLCNGLLCGYVVCKRIDKQGHAEPYHCHAKNGGKRVCSRPRWNFLDLCDDAKLAQEEAEPCHHKAEPHEGYAGAEPCKEGALVCKVFV